MPTSLFASGMGLLRSQAGVGAAAARSVIARLPGGEAYAQRFDVVTEKLAALPDRLENAAVVGVRTGLAWDLHIPAIKVAARGLMAGKGGPSLIYRVHAANTPDRVALIFHDRSITFAELDASCDAIAAGLRRRKLAGKTVIAVLKNRPEYLMLSTGSSRVGTSMVTVSWRSTPAELVYLANHCGAEAIIFEASIAPNIEKARAELTRIKPENFFVCGDESSGKYASFESLTRDGEAGEEAKEEGAVVVYTSGTTGKPKGAVRKFNSELLPALVRFFRETPLRHDDVHLASCPIYHTTAFGFITMSHVLGATVVLLDEFEPYKYLEALEKHKCTTSVLVPTMLHRLLKIGDAEIMKHDTRSLRALFFTSAPLPGPDSDHAMRLFGDVVFNLYGSTETGVVTLAQPEDLKRSPGTIGRAVPGNEIRLLDDAGNEVKPGGVGELYAKNAMLVAGYHADDEATKSSMRDGFFSVGDLARIDERGCYHLEGRKRDMIISGGVNVYPAEVEACLEAHPHIDEVAVIGVPDPEWGERVQAVLVLKGRGAKGDRAAHDHAVVQADLKAYCKERLGGAKVPREFIILPTGEALPRNPTGKVLKRELRARATTTPVTTTSANGAAR